MMPPWVLPYYVAPSVLMGLTVAWIAYRRLAHKRSLSWLLLAALAVSSCNCGFVAWSLCSHAWEPSDGRTLVAVLGSTLYLPAMMLVVIDHERSQYKRLRRGSILIVLLVGFIETAVVVSVLLAAFR